MTKLPQLLGCDLPSRAGGQTDDGVYCSMRHGDHGAQMATHMGRVMAEVPPAPALSMAGDRPKGCRTTPHPARGLETGPAPSTYVPRRRTHPRRELLSIGEERAWLVRDGMEVEVDLTERQGRRRGRGLRHHRIPVDGTAESGEALPVYVQPGSEVYAGTLISNGSLTMRATSVGQDTVVGCQASTWPLPATASGRSRSARVSAGNRPFSRTSSATPRPVARASLAMPVAAV